MWTLDFYSVGGAALEGTGAGTVAVISAGLEAYRTMGTLQQAGAQFAATFVVAVTVLELLQGYGPQTVTKCRRSPVISICIGVPSVLVIGGLTSTGYLLVGTSLGTFFGVPVVIVGSTALFVLTILGFVAIAGPLRPASATTDSGPALSLAAFSADSWVSRWRRPSSPRYSPGRSGPVPASERCSPPAERPGPRSEAFRLQTRSDPSRHPMDALRTRARRSIRVCVSRRPSVSDSSVTRKQCAYPPKRSTCDTRSDRNHYQQRPATR